VFDQLWQHPPRYRAGRSQADNLSTHSAIEGRSVRISFDRKAIGTLAYRQLSRPRKKCSADTATQDCRLDEQLEQICFASNDFYLRNANKPAILICNHD
jgi:hypothetical protein